VIAFKVLMMQNHEKPKAADKTKRRKAGQDKTSWGRSWTGLTKTVRKGSRQRGCPCAANAAAKAACASKPVTLRDVHAHDGAL